MTQDADKTPAVRSTRQKWATPLLWVALPALSVGYQIAAKHAAVALEGVPVGVDWVLRALRLPWGQAMIVMELFNFAAWMVVLAEIKLSSAFSISALSYVMVILASWTIFHEHVGLLEIIGSAAIVGGVLLIGGEDKPAVPPT